MNMLSRYLKLLKEIGIPFDCVRGFVYSRWDMLKTCSKASLWLQIFWFWGCMGIM